MGGGDLNSKKSWHPNTMKNQERVWKAEQAAIEEKKRILELQRERAEERDRTELKDLMVKHNTASPANENRLSWMYDKPDKKVEQEEYLLGRSIDKKPEAEKTEQDAIPAIARRVGGSSMVATTTGDAQVDLVRKLREDPLLLIKERERAARAALLNNPLQRRKLTELLRKEQDERKESKLKKKPKKKDKDLDDMLAAKLTALSGQKGIDLATLLNSDDSSSDSSSGEEKPVKKKKKKSHEKSKKKSKKSKKKKKQSSDDSSEDEKRESHKKDAKSKHKSSHQENDRHKSKSKKRQSDEESDNTAKKRFKKDTPDNQYDTEYDRKRSNSNKYESKTHHSSSRGIDRAPKRDGNKRGGLSEEEKAARLAEMAAAGAEREVQRGKRVADQRAADAAADRAMQAPRSYVKTEARSLPDSLENRIHSNRHYIQRDKRHMNEHFARR